jgi:type IV pilus assembly protein PilV
MYLKGRQARGFSLTEVLVALVVCGIGLLGLAKMESLALASTDVAGTRSIAALEAASLAAMMHADRAFWISDPSVLVPTNLSGGTVATPLKINNTTLSQTVPANCTNVGATSCSAAQLAALDVSRWAADLSTWLPAYSATILCSQNPTSSANPAVTCEITLNWIENAVAVGNAQTGIASASASAAFTSTPNEAPTYALIVEP